MKYMIYLFWSLLLLFPLYSQAQKQIDILTLKDDSQIRGFITEERTNGDIDFIMLGGYPIHLKAEHITSKEKGPENVLYYEDGRSIRTSGYYGVYKISSTWSNVDDAEGNFSGMHFHTIQGHQFNDFLAVGGGIGLDVIGGKDFRTYTFLPIYVDIRGFPIRGKVSPYYALSLGYGFAFDAFDNFDDEADERYSGGIMIAPALGLRFASRKKGQFLLELGYKMQYTDAQYQHREFGNPFTSGYFIYVNRETFFRRLEVSFGWIF